MKGSRDTVISSPLGKLQLQVKDKMMAAVKFLNNHAINEAPALGSDPLLKKARTQFEEYFNGERAQFNLPLLMQGTAFEKEVWSELRHIPFGCTVTYKELAKRLGDEKKVRAVGRANAKNPLSVIVPCHRVIGKNNKLTGYAGGVERKRWLLQHEGALLL